MFNSRMTLAEIQAVGGYFTREHYPFGKCDTYRLPDGTSRYAHHGEYVTWEILSADLRETWVPQAQEDRTWHRLNVA